VNDYREGVRKPPIAGFIMIETHRAAVPRVTLDFGMRAFLTPDARGRREAMEEEEEELEGFWLNSTLA
jgi:hypothetical protein